MGWHSMNASSPGQTPGPDPAQLRRILGSEAGQQLLRLLASGNGERLRQAAAAIKAGDQAQAYALLQPILDTEQTQALLRQLHG